MKTKNEKKGEASNSYVEEERLLKRREAIKKIKWVAISAVTLMVLMPSKAKADDSGNPGLPL
jgi:hypothetical protein